LAELTSNGIHEGTNRYEIGNPNLKSEQNFQTDIALEYNTRHVEFFANGFYNLLNDYIYISPTGGIKDGADVFKYEQDNAKLYGGEIGFHLHPHPLDWLHFESSFEMVIGKQKNGDYLPLIPANKLKNTLRGEFNIVKWWKNAYVSTSVNSTFQQKNVSAFETKSDAYTLVNFSLGGDFSIIKLPFNLTMNLNNAFNKSYISHLSRLKNDGIDNIGRNFTVGLKFNL